MANPHYHAEAELIRVKLERERLLETHKKKQENEEGK
jgi:hypothetical protein